MLSAQVEIVAGGQGFNPLGAVRKGGRGGRAGGTEWGKKGDKKTPAFLQSCTEGNRERECEAGHHMLVVSLRNLCFPRF